MSVDCRVDTPSGGTSSGSFSVAAGAGLSLVNQTLTGPSSVTGAGLAAWTNSTVGGTYGVTGATQVEGLTDFAGTVSSVGDDLTIYGTADFHGTSLSLTNLSLSGALVGSGAATAGLLAIFTAMTMLAVFRNRFQGRAGEIVAFFRRAVRA